MAVAVDPQLHMCSGHHAAATLNTSRSINAVRWPSCSLAHCQPASSAKVIVSARWGSFSDPYRVIPCSVDGSAPS